MYDIEVTRLYNQVMLLPDIYLLVGEKTQPVQPGNNKEELEFLAVHLAQHTAENSWVCDKLLRDYTEHVDQALLVMNAVDLSTD